MHTLHVSLKYLRFTVLLQRRWKLQYDPWRFRYNFIYSSISNISFRRYCTLSLIDLLKINQIDRRMFYREYYGLIWFTYFFLLHIFLYVFSSSFSEFKFIISSGVVLYYYVCCICFLSYVMRILSSCYVICYILVFIDIIHKHPHITWWC